MDGLVERYNQKTSEDDAWSAVIRDRNAEGEDVVGENSATPESNGKRDVSGQSSAVPESDAGAGREESSTSGDEGFQPEKKVKGGIKRRDEENSTACLVPGQTWLEQVRARVRAISTYWLEVNEATGHLKTEKKKQRDTRYTIHLADKQGEHL
ncbi:hypothetical protein NDU88_006292 [Pleurodeles waltl]|uniref:Uncharacterized protein n=1 Tax=Pleurodeles waltl TaxID=8319 RepID=A0AAV7WF54_PLEWA|nr:hypothetical protein NDU88_006292 [Pleurodeles waltl]